MADKTLCKIDGCGKPAYNVRGWCQKHYTRWLRHGDPLFLARRPAGGKCSVDGCGKPIKGQGLCNAHYQRQVKHGSPNGGSTGWGEVRRWLDEVAVPYRGDECLTFPYSTDRHGYGRVNIDGKYVGAHVYVAEKVLPPRPSDQHEVCHKCGHGDQACVASGHLNWGTRKDNVQDAIAHGTFSPPPNRWLRR